MKQCRQIYKIDCAKASNERSQMDALITFAESDLGRSNYPRLLKAINGLNSMVGMDDVKSAVADDIKTVIAYDLLDKPQRMSPVQTRSRTGAKKRKKQSRVGQSRKRRSKKKLKPLDIEATSLGEFLEKLNERLDDDSDWEEEEEEGCESRPVKSIRGKRTQDLKLHTLLLGTPGTGKTTLARKLAYFWEAIGLCNDKFLYLTKGDMASKWQGGSLEMMRDLIKDYSNGVIFIDEAYSMVTDSKDSYGTEMLHYIVHCMTDPECTTTFIMAGYADLIKGNLFKTNEGLSRRFHSVFMLNRPTPVQMTAIFQSLCRAQKGWKCAADPAGLTAIFQKSKDKFKDAGGDVEAFVTCSLKAHINRFFPERITQRVSLDDVSKGLAIFLRNKQKKDTTTHACTHLYT